MQLHIKDTMKLVCMQSLCSSLVNTTAVLLMILSLIPSDERAQSSSASLLCKAHLCKFCISLILAFPVQAYVVSSAHG